MNDFGEMSVAGSVLSKSEMRERRKKRGECEKCGTKILEKHLFKTVPITVEDEVLEGRCLRCYPLTAQDTMSQDMSQENQNLKKSGRLSWRMGKKFFRSNSDNSNSDNFSLSGKSDTATTEPSSTSSVSVTNTPIPARIRYPENVIEEENEEDASRYNHAIAGAAELQLQREYSSQKKIRAEVDQKQEMLRHSSSSSIRNSPRPISARSTSSHPHKLSIEDLHLKDLEVKKYLRVRATEQSMQLDERIDRKLRNVRTPTKPAIEMNAKTEQSMQLDERIDRKLRNVRTSAIPTKPAIEMNAKPRALDLDDNQILSKMEEKTCTYTDILDIAALYPSRLRVQQRAIHFLSKSDHTESDLSNILDSGYSTAVIFGGMKKFPNDKKLQLNACFFLWKISMTSNKNKLAAAHAGGVKTTLNVMRNFQNDEQLQEIAVAVLSNLCQVQEIQLSVFELGGIKKIVQAMAIHHTSVAIQAHSCTALSHLAEYDYSMKTTINEAKGCEQISIAMVENPNLEFLHKALHAIRAICADHEENKMSAVNCGITDSIVSSMQVHRNEAELQAAAASTIWCLGSSEVTSLLIGESGGIDFIVRAMWLHSDHLDMQRSSCHSLYVLSKNTENQALIAEISGIGAVINAMQICVDDADVQEHSCGILANVAQLDDDTRALIVADEALDAITITMVIHTDDVRVQDKACLLLLSLACTSTLDPLRASNVIQLIKSAAIKFPDECRENAQNLSRMLRIDCDN